MMPMIDRTLTMDGVAERFVEVAVAPDRLEEARALRPISERRGLGRTHLLFDGTPRDRVAALGETRTPGPCSGSSQGLGRASTAAPAGARGRGTSISSASQAPSALRTWATPRRRSSGGTSSVLALPASVSSSPSARGWGRVPVASTRSDGIAYGAKPWRGSRVAAESPRGQSATVGSQKSDTAARKASPGRIAVWE